MSRDGDGVEDAQGATDVKLYRDLRPGTVSVANYLLCHRKENDLLLDRDGLGTLRRLTQKL